MESNQRDELSLGLTVTEGTRREISNEFLQGMVNRMAVSFFKYGAVADAYPDKVDALASLTKRLEKYAQDGNTEWLMDVANFAMIEFMHPSHPQAHFEGTDSDASPGRKFVDSEAFTDKANTPAKQQEQAGAAARSFYASRHGE